MAVIGERNRSRIARRTILITILLLILSGLLLTIWPTALGGRATWAHVTGQSMEPHYYTGDLILTWNTGAWQRGDVVLYQLSGTEAKLIVHRLLNRNPDGTWIAQGDNNLEPDPYPIADPYILGEEILHLPHLGAVLRVARDTPTLLLSILILTLWGIWVAGRRGRTQTRVSTHPIARIGDHPGIMLDVHENGALFTLSPAPRKPPEEGTPITVWIKTDPTGKPLRGILTVTHTRRKHRQLLIGGHIQWDPADAQRVATLHPLEETPAPGTTSSTAAQTPLDSSPRDTEPDMKPPANPQ